MRSTREILLVAGEASGDLHGARLLAALRREVGELHAFGLGGGELAAAGLEIVPHESFAVVGLLEVLRVLGRARRTFADLVGEVERRRPAAAILVDFPEFNLRLARALKKTGVPVVYYISPQVWAWRRYRVRQIARSVDLMLVLFPFEAEFYAAHGVAALHVGHPLVDEVPALPQAWDAEPATGPFKVALLPGSRPSEVEALLPVLLAAARLLAAELAIEPFVVRAPTIPAAELERLMAAAGYTVPVVDRDRFAAVAGAHLALCASGTATLETGLLGTPLIVVYRLSALTYRLARVLVRLPHFSLVNLVLGRGVVPELLQHAAEPANVAKRAAALLRDPASIAAMRGELAALRDKLGERGASGRAAAAIAAHFGWRGAA